MEVILFGLKLKVSPVAFSLPIGENGWDIYWYGILIATGVLLALIYGMKNAPRLGIDVDKMIDVVIVTLPLALVCARLYYVLFDGVPVRSFKDLIGLSDSSGISGLAIYGGVIGAFVIGGIMCRVKKVSIPSMFDLAALGFLIGQGIGRWGNFINQEAFGSPTGSTWWGMMSVNTGNVMVHPCFLYESIWCAIGFIVLHKISKQRDFKGQVFLMYLAWYGFGRGFIELLRTDSLMFLGLKVSSVLSFVLCIAAVSLIVWIKKRQKPVVYDEIFAEENEEDKENDKAD